jgi:glycosyltransferase involved in cell wall biosynthesis
VTPGLRVLILSHYYPPEIGAPQTRLHETALGLRGLGAEVRVLTGPPHYPTGRVAEGYGWRTPRRELIDGIDVTRLPMIPRPNGGFVDRSIDNGSFAVSALWAIRPVRWADVVLVESPPLFLGLTAAVHRLVTRRPYVFHVADPWPDFPIAMGALRSPIARRLAYANEWLAYRHAAAITTVTPSLVERLARKRGATGKVHLLPNGVDVHRFRPDVEPATARRALGWDESVLTLVYAGTVGRAQGVDALLGAMHRIQGSGIALHIVGGGIERTQIADRVRHERLADVHVHEPVRSGDVPAVLAAADAILVLLRRGVLYEESLPTKLVEGLAAGRPMLVSADGGSAAIVRRAGAGLTASAQDADGLASSMIQMRDAVDRSAMGIRARAVAVEEFDRERILTGLAAILETAAARDNREQTGRARPDARD